MNIVQSIEDPQLFGSLFKDLDSWRAWVVILRAVFGLEMSNEERTIFQELSGRDHAPATQCDEVWIAAGRRSGKSRMASIIGVYLAAFVDYRPYVAVGERVTVMLMSGDKKQARTLYRYVLNTLESVEMLKSMIVRVDAESIDLNNNVTVEVLTNNFRSLRGYTVAAAILDEVAFWRSEESANPDFEVVNALRPSLSTIPHSKLIGISSAYRRSGILYNEWKRHFANNESSTLVIQAPTPLLNPLIPSSVITKAEEADATAARSEWYAEFRNDLSSFLDVGLIERAVTVGVRERPPIHGMRYQGFADPSGGSHDSFTLAIAHQDKDRVVLDVCRGIKPPFSPESVVKEFSNLLRAYRLSSVTGDKYAGQWVVESFAKESIHYRHSELNKSELYLECLHLFTTGLVSLLDYQPLLLELQQLERHTARSGKDSIDHVPGGHDDLANACCGVLAMQSSRITQAPWLMDVWTGAILETPYSEEQRLLHREARLKNVPIEVIRSRWETVEP
ncbi:MAG: hypothetical protein KF747_15415 [Nitrospira sp.]|nr:hypothetical protein [Nitrospira sp.]